MRVTFGEALKVWARIGVLSFGGPAGQIALMHREIVEERHWLSEKEYLAALNFCMLLPGPEAMQLATYAGWKLHGVRGGLAAGLLFVLPGAAIVLALTMLYASFGNLPWIDAIFYGIKAAVLAIVIEALLRVAKRALKTNADWVIAALAFLALYCFALPFPLIIIAAALYGFIRSSGLREEYAGSLPRLGQLGGTISLWAAIWLVPLATLALFLGPHHVLTEIGIFFSKLAVVTFGGAYAVLSYMAQAAVEKEAWLTAPEMIDGLALAETTPGPLILVTQFVGYLAALREMGSVWGGIAGALVTLWMTFAPCFLWIFAGAPYIEAIGKRPRLAGALAAITAAVVGVILNLSLWFGLHVLFGKVERLDGWFQPWLPDWAGLDWFALVLSVVAALALLRFHLGVVKTLLTSAILGLLMSSLSWGAIALPANANETQLPSNIIELSAKAIEKDPHLVWNEFIDIIAFYDHPELSPMQKRAALAFLYYSQVMNGGHHQYFANFGVENARTTAGALDELGFSGPATILKRAIDVSGEVDWSKIDTIDQFIASASEGGFDKMDDEFHQLTPSMMDLFETHLRQHQSEYIRIVE